MSRPAFTAWHVGRVGEVAGGMTQVVNGYVRWPFERLSIRVIRSRDGSRGPMAYLLYLRALREIWIRVHDNAREVVVVHLSQGGSFIREGLLLWIAHLRGFGTVAHLHGSSFVAFARRWPRLVRAVLRNADRVVVLSEATGAAAASLVGAHRVVMIPNAVPAGDPVSKEKLVVFGGAVGRRKGVDVLAAAWRMAQPASDWRLVVAGPVVDAEVVLPDLPQATYAGGVAHDELMRLLDRASVAVLPSRDEAMPMFILEALARNACVIATSVGGIPAVLAQGRGVLVPSGDVDQLAVALRRAMQDDAWRDATAAAGRQVFDERYAAATVYPRLESLWLGVLPRGSGAMP